MKLQNCSEMISKCKGLSCTCTCNLKEGERIVKVCVFGGGGGLGACSPLILESTSEVFLVLIETIS